MSSGAGSPCLQVTVEDLKCTIESCPWAEPNFNALVRVEVRGDGKPVKAMTSLKSVHGLVIAWHETLELPLSSDASELRLMLCKEKSAIPGKKGNPVMAACGIYIKDIMDAVPIDKYFQVFKPSSGTTGGDIRVRLNVANSRSALADPGDSTIPEEDDDADSDKPRRGGLLRKLLLLAALGAAGVVAYKRQQI